LVDSSKARPDGASGEAWWTPPAADNPYAPTGLAFDESTNTLIVTDSNNSAIFRVALDGASADILYEHGTRAFTPVFDGVTVTPDGTIYVAALEQNGIAVLRDGELEYVAGSFRGSSDVDYHDGSLYVTNFDSLSLVVSAVRPRLPFAIDLIDLP
jgi:sugar lactone lactonase YvrE